MRECRLVLDLKEGCAGNRQTVFRVAGFVREAEYLCIVRPKQRYQTKGRAVTASCLRFSFFGKSPTGCFAEKQ